jgi:hypothetical protein
MVGTRINLIQVLPLFLALVPEFTIPNQVVRHDQYPLNL